MSRLPQSLAPLPPEFYARDPATVAPELLGKWLVRRTSEGVTAGVIVEVEAYRGRQDPASHAFRGPTPRARIMYGPPGRAYVYFIYGNHHCLNAVAHEQGEAGAVLIRALEPRVGVELMRRRRGGRRELELTNGPGKLCQALGIDGSANGLPLDTAELQLCFHSSEDGVGEVVRGPRVGISRAVDEPLRFFLAGNPWVSRSRPGPPRSRRR